MNEQGKSIPFGNQSCQIRRLQMAILPLCVFADFLSLTLLLYRPVMFDVPRSDQLVTYSVLGDAQLTYADLNRIVFVEFFGDKRFQPLAFLLHYVQFKVFGTQFLLYHLVNIVLHATNGTLIFLLLRSIWRKTSFNVVVALLFLTAFTSFDVVSWTFHFYIILQVTLALGAFFCFLKLRHCFWGVSLSYVLLAVQTYLYEPGVILPIVLFLYTVTQWWQDPQRRRWIYWSVPILAVILMIWAGGGLAYFLQNRTGTLPAGLNWLKYVQRIALGLPFLLANTVILHNILPLSRVVMDELAFLAPFTLQSLFGWPGLLANLPSAVAFILLLTLARKPSRHDMIPLLIVLLGLAAYVSLIAVGRPPSYLVTQSRYAYFPTLIACFLVAFFYHHYFSDGKKLFSASTWRGPLVLAIFSFFIVLNALKIGQQVKSIHEYAVYTNNIVYAVKRFVENSESAANRLFVSIPSYPPHEKLAWASDIVLDVLFPQNSRLTRNLMEATHIMRSPDRIELFSERSRASEWSGFTAEFGLMYHNRTVVGPLEVFAYRAESAAASDIPAGRQWFVRLDFPADEKVIRAGDRTSEATLKLGFISDGREVTLYSSRPVITRLEEMNHFVIGMDSGQLYLIFNGVLVQKITQANIDDFRDVQFQLGRLYQMGYRRPYYIAHTKIQIGQSRFSVANKSVGYEFKEINFNRWGFQDWAIHNTR